MIYVETSYYGVSFLYQYTLYPGGACVQPRVPVHSRGWQSISWWRLCIAGVSVHSRGRRCIAGVPVFSRGWRGIAWWRVCIAEGARALLRSALRHPRLQKIASSRRGNNCYVHFNEKQKETHLTSLFVYSSYSFYLAFFMRR